MSGSNSTPVWSLLGFAVADISTTLHQFSVSIY